MTFEPIGFTPSLGSANYLRNGFEVFSGSGLETRLTDGTNLIGLAIEQVSGLPTLFTTGSDLRIAANDVGLNTNDPQLELHIANGNYQLFLDNGNNEWLLGAERNSINLLFRLRSNNNFLFLNGNTLNFGAVSEISVGNESCYR